MAHCGLLLEDAGGRVEKPFCQKGFPPFPRTPFPPFPKIFHYREQTRTLEWIENGPDTSGWS